MRAIYATGAVVKRMLRSGTAAHSPSRQRIRVPSARRAGAAERRLAVEGGLERPLALGRVAEAGGDVLGGIGHEDRAAAHVDGDALDRRWRQQLASAGVAPARPEVDPVAGWQLEFALPSALLEHRGDPQGRPVPVLVSERPDAEALADALCELAAAPALRGRLANAALEEARGRTWERALERLAEGYGLALEEAGCTAERAAGGAEPETTAPAADTPAGARETAAAA
jgi:hypothetical protein